MEDKEGDSATAPQQQHDHQASAQRDAASREPGDQRSTQHKRQEERDGSKSKRMSECKKQKREVIDRLISGGPGRIFQRTPLLLQTKTARMDSTVR
jgi:hypothetical protein